MRALFALTLVGLLATTLSQPGEAFPPNSGAYTGPGTIVLGVNTNDLLGNGDTLILADNGAVTCTNTDFAGGNAAGLGGICIPFNELVHDSVYVEDDLYGSTNLAFQVCVDNNGDSICTGNGESFFNLGGCSDLIAFSHDSQTGLFHNPLWIPPWFEIQWSWCNPGNAFPGYIVIVCAGVDTFPTPHQHDAGNGRIYNVQTGGTGHGNFCGGPTAAKAYTVV